MVRSKISDDVVRSLAAEGAPDSAIATSLGVHRETVRRRRVASSTPSGRAAARAARLARVRELHAQGLSDGEIARQTGRETPSGVVKDRAALGLSANRGSRRT